MPPDLVARGGAAAAWSTVIAGVVASVALAAFVPEYVGSRGFPLDDAWIHAVYARELATTGMLAYNPGVAATGETSPLWAAWLAAIYRLIGPEQFVAAAKVGGLALHAASAGITAHLLVSVIGVRPRHALILTLPAVLQPDLLAASASGMEVPLACCLAVSLVWTAASGRSTAFGVLCGLAILVRPELAVFSAVIAAAAPQSPGALRRRRVLSWVIGTSLAAGAIGLRNLLVSGMWLPATFHAKVGGAALTSLTGQVVGWRSMVGGFAGVETWLFPALTLAAAVAVLSRRARSSPDGVPATAVLASVAFIATSLALILPVDPSAFYHQRYVLPALGTFMGMAPLCLATAIPVSASGLRTPMALCMAAAMTVMGVVALPSRLERLSNDARNVDDVQVRMGRALALSQPADVLWAIDAGAVRYHGRAFVIDMMGLNTPEMLAADGASLFLDARRPRYLDLFPTWSRVEMNARPEVRMFETSTPYTVTSIAAMRQHGLVTCPPGAKGVMTVRARLVAFTCAD